MKKSLVALFLLWLPMMSWGQSISNPRVKIRSCDTCQTVLYEAVSNTPAGTYPPTVAGRIAFQTDVRAGLWQLTLDNGAVIPSGTKPPRVPPSVVTVPPSQTVAGPSWAQAQYSFPSDTLYVEASGEVAGVRFERADGTLITGKNKDGVNLNNVDFYGPGPNPNRGSYDKQWKARFSPSLVGKPTKLTYKRTNGELFSNTFTPVANASKVVLFTATNTSPPPSTTVTNPPSTTVTNPPSNTQPAGTGTLDNSFSGVYAANSTYTARGEMGGRPAYAQPSWITNGTLRVGITPTAGDVITHFQVGQGQSVVNNPIFSNGKLDLGRQFMDAIYANPDGSNNDDDRVGFGEGPFYDPEYNQSTSRYKGGGQRGSIGWNPVEGGDESYKGTDTPNPNASQVLEHAVESNRSYNRSRPLQWDLDNVPGKMYIEKWLDFDPNSSYALRMHRRWTLFRDDPQSELQGNARQQEMPCLYTTPHFREYYYCDGQPYQNNSARWIQSRNQEPFLSTEPFIFARNPETGWTIVLYAPGVGRFTCGRFIAGEGLNGGDSEPGWENPSGLSAGYIAAAQLLHLDKNTVLDIDNAIGLFPSIEQARSWAYNQPRSNGLPEYRFDQGLKSRQGFTYHHSKDQLEKNMGQYMEVTPIIDKDNQGRDMRLALPERWIDGRTVKHLYTRAAFQASQSTISIRWLQAGKLQEAYSHSFPINPNGGEQVYDFDLSSDPNWNNKDIVACWIELGNIRVGAPSAAGNTWRFKWISYRNLN